MRESRHLHKIPAVVLNFLHDPEEPIPACLFCRVGVDDANKQESDSSKVHHVSFTGGEVKIDRIESMQRLRSLLAFGGRINDAYISLPQHLEFLRDMVQLRTLELSYTTLTIMPESISYLRNLRFLGLNGTRIKVLPPSVCTLSKLQALELKSCNELSELPDSIGELTNLQHLSLGHYDDVSFYMPTGLSRLTDLRTLPIFKLGGERTRYAGISELGGLDKLEERLCIVGLPHDDKDVESAHLDRKKKLILKLCWSSPPPPEAREEHKRRRCNFNGLKPHDKLDHLIIKSYCGHELPSWISSRTFKQLSYIELASCVACEFLPSLGQLVSLRLLNINCPKVKRIDANFCGGNGSFPSLKQLVFLSMWNLEEWNGVKEDDFKALQTLVFDDCPKFEGELAITSIVDLTLLCCGPIRLSKKVSALKHLWVEECEISLDDKAKTKLKELDSLLVANCSYKIIDDFEVEGLGSDSYHKDANILSFVNDREG